MNKYFKLFIRFLKENNKYQLFINNFDKAFNKKWRNDNHVHYFDLIKSSNYDLLLILAFDFTNSKEGFKSWMKIDSKWFKICQQLKK